MKLNHVVGLLCGLAWVFLAGCRPAGGVRHPREGVDLRARAEKLAREALVVDTHIDVPYRLMKKMEDISVRTEKGDFDYPRARAGGLKVAFMSIYVPASYQTSGGALEYADELIDLVESFEADWPDKFTVVRSTPEVLRQDRRGKILLALGMENGAPIEDDLSNLRHFRDRGIRYITLTHSEDNQICDSSYSKEKKWRGLSPFGRQVVAEMNRLGIMVDVSHVSDEAFYQVMEVSRAPVIASHSSCRKFTSGWERNMDDAMIRLLASKGGIIQINFGSTFLLDAARKQSQAFQEERRRYREAHHLDPDDEEAVKPFADQYWKDHPRIYADVADVAAHIEHVVQMVGPDHVGFGSDFDGVGDTLPSGLKDVSHYPNLIYELLRRGYSEEDVRKICGGNLLRVWSQVEKIATEPR